MADVYRGDDDQQHGAATAVSRSDVLFVVETDPDPDALSRIAGVLSLANCPPSSGRIVTTSSGQLAIALELRAVPVPSHDLILRKLSQLTCVTRADAHVISGRAQAAAEHS